MNAFLKTLCLCFLVTYFTPGIANKQSRMEKPRKHVEVSRIRVTEDTVFLQNSANQWMQLSIPVGAPVAGILNFFFPERHFIAKCENCGTEYVNRAPDSCEVCGFKDYELKYVEDDYWDKNG